MLVFEGDVAAPAVPIALFTGQALRQQNPLFPALSC